MKNDIIHSLKKFLFPQMSISSIILFVFFVPCLSFAEQLKDPLRGKSFTQLITAILNIMRDIGVPIAGLFFVYAGFMFVTSRGEPKKLDTAKDVFLWTCIGTAIIVGASIIMAILQSTVNSLK